MLDVSTVMSVRRTSEFVSLELVWILVEIKSQETLAVLTPSAATTIITLPASNPKHYKVSSVSNQSTVRLVKVLCLKTANFITLRIWDLFKMLKPKY